MLFLLCGGHDMLLGQGSPSWEAAKELRDEAQKLIQRMQRSAEEATLKSDKSMKERVNENQHVTWLYLCESIPCMPRGYIMIW